MLVFLPFTFLVLPVTILLQFYIDPAKILPLQRFLPSAGGRVQKRGGGGRGRGGGGSRGGFRGGKNLSTMFIETTFLLQKCTTVF